MAVRAFNEIETVITLSKYDRINNGIAKVWTNDSVVINSLEKLGVNQTEPNYYELSLEDFNILPKRKSRQKRTTVKYPNLKPLPNDTKDKETLIYYTQADRQKKILHIFTDDEYFLARCMRYNLPYKNNSFVSNDDFRPFGKKAKLSPEERKARGERMREAKAAARAEK